ncbi:MAG: hypothetical protein PQJ59_11040 [Spirochaetales bacterium]|nr:hypothetical protein [Spirochaetales bacterium]
MKKAIIIICLLGLIIPFIAAQDAVDTWKGTEVESEYYSVNLMIYRISPHPDGYRVEYYKPNGELFAVYVSLDWFEQGNHGPGQVVWGQGPQYPYMSLYYKDGKIDHMRLYVIDNEYDSSWGTLDRSKDYSDKFGVAFEDFKIEY